jgi:F-type H+-transporting ATPase subunit alpha
MVKVQLLAQNHVLLNHQLPGIIERRSVYEPLATGLIAVDAMILLVVVNVSLLLVTVKQVTSIAVDTILNQKVKVLFVYM